VIIPDFAPNRLGDIRVLACARMGTELLRISTWRLRTRDNNGRTSRAQKTDYRNRGCFQWLTKGFGV